MNIQTENYDGAFEILDGIFKGQVVIRDLVTEFDHHVTLHGDDTVLDQAAKHLNQLGFHVVGTIKCSAVRTIMIVKRK